MFVKMGVYKMTVIGILSCKMLQDEIIYLIENHPDITILPLLKMTSIRSLFKNWMKTVFHIRLCR